MTTAPASMLRARGKSREEIHRFVADAFAKGIFQPPSRLGVDYMLSTENLVPNEKGIVVPFPPHVMFYAPYLTNAELGVDRTDRMRRPLSPGRAPLTRSSSCPLRCKRDRAIRWATHRSKMLRGWQWARCGKWINRN